MCRAPRRHFSCHQSPLVRSSLAVGFEALRANPLRTILSTLGVVMGVAAMVSVLAMGDGVERFARLQIERTTSLLAVSVQPTAMMSLDGQRVRRDSVIQFRSSDAHALASALGAQTVGMATTGSAFVIPDGQTTPRGFGVAGTLARQFADHDRVFVAGGPFTDTDTAVVVLSAGAAGVVVGDSTRPADAVGRTLTLLGQRHRIIGVMAAADDDRGLMAVVPVDDAWRALGANRVPSITLTAGRIEEVEPLKERIETWLAGRYGADWKERVEVATSAARVAQAAQAIRIFKLLMVAITSVSLLVGGIGIMNVLLASVVERTREIGIRKAAGARHRDILVQFLGESVAITGVGAAVGVALGLGIAFIAAAIMRAQTQAPVHAAVTPGTIIFAATASIAIGIGFGLYPALRAARLSPIEAIRHE